MKQFGFRKKRISSAAGLCVVLVAVLLVFGGYALAKYMYSVRKDPLFVAKAFYFESDLLRDTSVGSRPRYPLQTGVNQISFSLRNHPDSLRCSEVDITYDVVLTKEGIVIQKLEDQMITGNAINNKEVTFADLAAGTYTVTATATAPYTATLSAEFVIADENQTIQYEIHDEEGSPVLQMVVRTEGYEGNVKITWPEGVSPDNMDPLLEEASNSTGTVTIPFNAYSEYTFLFFKSKPNENYAANVGFSASIP